MSRGHAWVVSVSDADTNARPGPAGDTLVVGSRAAPPVPPPRRPLQASWPHSDAQPRTAGAGPWWATTHVSESLRAVAAHFYHGPEHPRQRRHMHTAVQDLEVDLVAKPQAAFSVPAGHATVPWWNRGASEQTHVFLLLVAAHRQVGRRAPRLDDAHLQRRDHTGPQLRQEESFSPQGFFSSAVPLWRLGLLIGTTMGT